MIHKRNNMEYLLSLSVITWLQTAPALVMSSSSSRKANHDLHGVIEQKVDALLWKHTKEYAVKVDFGHSTHDGMMGRIGKMMEDGCLWENWDEPWWTQKMVIFW